MSTPCIFVLDIDNVQGYVFDTNRLKTIIGASWLLDYLNAGDDGKTLSLLQDSCGFPTDIGGIRNDKNFIYSSGGNTVLIFPSKTVAEAFEQKIVFEYSRFGISVTTHIQELSGSDEAEDFKQAQIKLLNKKYGKTGSECLPASPFFKVCELCGKRYAEKTIEDKVIACHVCSEKFKRAREKFRHLPDLNFKTDLKELMATDDMVALVVIDGNNMGEKIKNLKTIRDTPFFENLKVFSGKTEEIFSTAFKECIGTPTQNLDINFIRPLIMGGDDICFIIDAGLALKFVKDFTEKVEKASKQNDEVKNIFSGGITLCAGILFMKKNYPFNFGHRIAESLLRSAKKASRKHNNKSFMDFHILQSTSGDEIDQTRMREYNYEAPVSGRMILTKKPYEISEINSFLADAEKLRDCLSRTKVKGYLRRVLRLGLEKSTTELLKVSKKLQQKDRKIYIDLLNEYGWRKAENLEPWKTGLLDLIEITEILGGN